MGHWRRNLNSTQRRRSRRLTPEGQKARLRDIRRQIDRALYGDPGSRS